MASITTRLVVLALVTAGLALTPAASAGHTCGIEGNGDGPVAYAIQTADRVCEGYHGHYCEDGKYLNYGFFGICL